MKANTTKNVLILQTRERLREVAGLPHRTIRLTMDNGTLVLKGQVQNHYQKHLATVALRSVPGLDSVQNLLCVRRQPQSSVTTACRLAQLSKQIGPRVSVELDCQTVHLYGQVNSWQERMEVEQAILAIPGIHSVENSLQVNA